MAPAQGARLRLQTYFVILFQVHQAFCLAGGSHSEQLGARVVLCD